MNLRKNNKWHDQVGELFQFNVELKCGNEKCNLSYALFNEEGVLLCYGFDLPDDSLKEEDIFEFLLKDKQINGELSLMTQMFKLYDFGENPLVFLCAIDKIYFMPNGIKQTNPYYWQTLESPKQLLEIIRKK